MLRCTPFILAAALLATGCDTLEEKYEQLQLKVKIQGADDAPAGSLVTTGLAYQSLEAKRATLDLDESQASVALAPAFTAALAPAPFARIAHLSDIQIREERGLLLGDEQTSLIERASGSFTAVEGIKRPSLMEANSPYVWLAMAMTLNALDQQYPVDVAVHTGDAVDLGLKSELDHFLYVAGKLRMPFLEVAGNHDQLALGIWNATDTTYSLRINPEVDVEDAPDDATFQANGDRLVLDRATHTQLVASLADAQGPHAPTLSRLGSSHFGYDLAPQADDAFYTAVVRAPAAGLPGLQLVVLETNRSAGVDPEIDDRQLGWLNDTLDSAQSRQNLVVVAAHHPLMEVHRGDAKLGAQSEVVVSSSLQRLRDLLAWYPNVVLYLCGHTHLPEVVEIQDGAGALAFAQIDTGSLLVYPQEGSLVELTLAGTEVQLAARKMGPMLAPGSTLASRLQESSTAAAGDTGSRPRYVDWRSWSGSRPLPAFPVSVPKFSL